MDLRTDLALERHELAGQADMPGVDVREEIFENTKVTRITITSDEGAAIIEKPKGRYITIEVPPFGSDAELLDGRLNVVANEIRSMLPSEGDVLIAGLGNADITPDALGPEAVSLILATRHIGSEIADSAGLTNLRPVAAIVPGVLGQTGMETGEIIAGVTERIKPSAVIVIDALASRRLSRLGRTIQIADTGISPGSGVGNGRKAINSELLGVPVISIGVPTVVDGATMVYDLLAEQNENGADIKIDPSAGEMIVTPREIDLVIERASRLVAMGINCALQTGLSPEDLLELVS